MVLPDSPSHRVGAEPLKDFEQHKHLSRLWSMGKVQSKEELRDWIARTEKLHAQLSDGREEPLPPLQYAVEYKLDGLTINLTYRSRPADSGRHPGQRRGGRGDPAAGPNHPLRSAVHSVAGPSGNSGRVHHAPERAGSVQQNRMTSR